MTNTKYDLVADKACNNIVLFVRIIITTAS
jgi:hypothetical protein